MGLEGLSIGLLAETLQMSKSGVFAHFGSREELQISVVREYHDRFEHEVFVPALDQPRGLPRLRALFDNWMQRTSKEIDAGCLYIGGAVEFDDRPGPVRDALVHSVQKSLKEHGDKLSDEEKTKIEAAIKDAEEALKGDDKEAIDAKAMALSEAAQKLGEKMYADAAAAGAAPGADAAGGGKADGKKEDDGNVVDAEFTEVKDKK